MSKKSLIVLSICLVLGASIALYVWANGCCEGDPLCYGDVVHRGDCNFYFTVDHDREEGDQHQVRIVIQKEGDLTAVPYMMEIWSEWPYPICVTYDLLLNLDANSTYYYVFDCATEGCSGRDPDVNRYTLLTGYCD